jgi:hypothetical protein
MWAVFGSWTDPETGQSSEEDTNQAKTDFADALPSEAETAEA